MHSSLNYLTPRDYYRGNPDELLRIREEKIRMGRISMKEKNMKARKGGVMAGATPQFNSLFDSYCDKQYSF